jgi:hypothetical protein
VSDFNFQIGTLMFESHTLEQRLLVLFRMLSSPKPPVINCQQSTTCIKRNRKKPLQNTIENITQYPYRAYPPAKRTANKLRKMKRENTAPPHHFNRTVPAKTEPGKQKIRTVPPPTPTKSPNIFVPARHSTQRRLTHTNMYVTRLARKFPRAQHTQLRKTEHKTISIHTPLTGITMNKRKRKLSPLKSSITTYNIKNYNT